MWFWMNVPLMVLFFLLWTLVPLRMVLKHADTDTRTAAPDRDQPRVGQLTTVTVLPASSSCPPSPAVPQPAS